MYIDMFLMQGGWENHATECHEAAVSADVLLGWEADVHFRQQVCSFIRIFLFSCLWTYGFRVSPPKHHSRPKSILYFVLSLLI